MDHNLLKEVTSPNAPTTVNDQGGAQSLIKVRFDLVDGPAMFQMAAVLHDGAVKYGEDNWRKIPVADHINHLIMHSYAYLAGETSDAHLSHIMCRSMFAQAVELQGGPLGEFRSLYGDNQKLKGD